ncbi:TRAP transporter substrate-binding protein [Salibacterium lacus]|uniref:TRAP transporter substrate-binding protein n=1 Tax=Salibacterium lacus TaxID=1898109 RepID=A0ABW5T178_9BACI
MKKNRLYAGIAAAVGLTFAAGCSGGSESGESGETSGGSEGGNSEESVTIEFGHGAAESNLRHEAVMEFKSIVEENSDSLTVEVYPNEQVGSESEMIENISLNDLDMALAGAGIYTQYNDLIGATALPYLFDGYEHAWEVLDGPMGDRVAEPLLEDNIRILSYFENGIRHITNSQHPIESPDDLDGLSIRTPEADVSIDTLDALGANATPMAFGELYLGLQQGTVDGQENPLANIHAASFYEVQDYLSLTGHQYNALPLAISDEFWQSLSGDQQEVVQQAASDASQYHRDANQENEEQLLTDLEEQGMEINEPEKEPFREATQSVYDKYEDVYGAEFMEELQQAVEDAR